LLLPTLPRGDAAFRISWEFVSERQGDKLWHGAAQSGGNFCSRDDACMGLVRMMGNCFKFQFLQQDPNMLPFTPGSPVAETDFQSPQA